MRLARSLFVRLARPLLALRGWQGLCEAGKACAMLARPVFVRLTLPRNDDFIARKVFFPSDFV